MAQSGASGEAYLLDADARMLTGSRFETQLSQIGLLQAGQSSIQSVRAIDPGKNLWLEPGLPADYADQPLTRMAAALTAGESGMDLIGYRGYRGVPVVGAWHWYPDKGYGVVAEIDVDEAYEMFGSMRVMLFAVLLVMILVFMVMVSLMEGLNRRAGKALGLSEARYRQLFNLIPDAIVVHSDAKIIYCNPAAVKMFAASSEDELIGRGAIDLVHPDDRQRVAERIAGVNRLAGIENMQEACLLRVDGTSFMAEVESCAFLDAEGLDAVLVVARDISDRKLVEQERERLRVAVEQTPEGIMIADAKGDILYANPGAAAMTGRSLQELDGMSAAQARGGSVGDETYAGIVSSLQAGESWYGEFTLMRPGGESRTIERRVTPVIVSGKMQYHVSVDRDITEERRYQEQMEHTQRLESLGVLAGGIAHDF
ncbi:MAG: PAS domain S-box protein, partial [Mariprofundaceae bacterium]|nr:PAS domain S-box protein [Mariprofundaceae bacterium]